MAKKLTVAEVLFAIGISPAMLSMIKAGSRNPSIKTMRRLMEVERSCGIFPPEDRNLSRDALMEKKVLLDPVDQEALKAMRIEIDRHKEELMLLRMALRPELQQLKKELLEEIERLLKGVVGNT